jgi:hypothetical protein
MSEYNLGKDLENLEETKTHFEEFGVGEIDGELICSYSMKIDEIEEKYPIEKIQGVVSMLDKKVFMLDLETSFKDLCDEDEEFTVNEYVVNYENEHDDNEYILVRIIDNEENFAEFVMDV